MRVRRRRRDLVVDVRQHRGQRGAPVLHPAQQRMRGRRGRVHLHRRLGVGDRALLVAQDRLARDGELDLDSRDPHLVLCGLEHGRAGLQEVDEGPGVRHVRDQPHRRRLGRPRRPRRQRQRRRALAPTRRRPRIDLRAFLRGRLASQRPSAASGLARRRPNPGRSRPSADRWSRDRRRRRRTRHHRSHPGGRCRGR